MLIDLTQTSLWTKALTDAQTFVDASFLSLAITPSDKRLEALEAYSRTVLAPFQPYWKATEVEMDAAISLFAKELLAHFAQRGDEVVKALGNSAPPSYRILGSFTSTGNVEPPREATSDAWIDQCVYNQRIIG